MIESAIQLATSGRIVSPPNPAVGCVIVSAGSQQVLGSGHTQRTGGPHAEIMAMQDATNHGYSLRGATAYVTLEPCAHLGRTGPCCDALIAAGIKKVVASIATPTPWSRVRALLGFALRAWKLKLAPVRRSRANSILDFSAA